MESMSKEHSAHFNPAIEGKGFTPFIDSLIPHSLICNYAFANGRKSIEGLPAILASFPTLFNDAFISSNYSANNINSLANTLGKKGYSSAFFHGGNNGTMGFDNFVKSIGFQVYYGRNEYGNEADFDGKWGIFDHQFFPFFLQKLNAMQQPFLASIFSLSAHHPYTIPDEFKGKFPEGIIPIQQCITYSDYALSRFFAEAKTQDWYNNTLFVITADHTSEVAYGDFNNAAGRYAIPIIYFMPGDLLKGEINFTTQQLDIMPSILDYLHFDENFYSLGNSVFAENNYNEAIMYVNQQYQYISNETILHFNTENEPKYIQDSIPNFPFLRSNKKDTLDSQVRLKALVQQYTNDLLDDQMNAEKFLKQKIEE
jgi:phosphoglycerol transferase MdoB-like AlkP superfamily enzyme